MAQRPIANLPRRTLYGAFHDYVRGVFAEHSVRQRAVRTSRTRWLLGFAQRWENKAGISRK